jgi:hypothetical protein
MSELDGAAREWLATVEMLTQPPLNWTEDYAKGFLAVMAQKNYDVAPLDTGVVVVEARAEARKAALEEAAKVCDALYQEQRKPIHRAAQHCAHEIRKLAGKP